MKIILKPIFEWLTDEYTLFDDVLYNYIAIAIIGFAAFAVAWNIVGSLYRHNIISGRSSGSVLHWIIRLVTFVVMFSFVSLLFRVIRFIITIPLWLWFSLAGLSVVGAIFFFVVSKKQNKNTIDK